MDWGAISTALAVALIVGLVKHIVSDIELRKDFENLKKRVSKLDGINGH